MKSNAIIFIVYILFVSCTPQSNENDMEKNSSNNGFIAQSIVDELVVNFADGNERINKGIEQAAAFWTESNGTVEKFKEFVAENLIIDDVKRYGSFIKISTYFESLFGNFNNITLDLKEVLHLDVGEITDIDQMFGALDISSHFVDDMFDSKIAFYVILNYPFYTLEEKNILGEKWSRVEWAYARMGDIFTSRVPAALKQEFSTATTNADNYISEYNICMDKLIDLDGNNYFPKGMKLITHWGLRDELKSHYGQEDGLKKQQMIYNVMLRIIRQDIPSNIINSDKFSWNPMENKVYDGESEVEFTPEDGVRYQQILNSFEVLKKIDKFSLGYPTYILRKFEQEMEIPQEDVEEKFIKFISSPQTQQVAEIIKKRLGRDLQPFDIWYDGFKARSGISEEELNKLTKMKYPNKDAFAKDMPVILKDFGFDANKAEFISSKVDVDPSRGAGHAWGAQMKSSNSHLRTRIGKDGMDYKGYNIAIHEFGHNVEQTITLHDVDYYTMSGVPNTAFTEAMAFVFQSRDLEMLGLKENNPDKIHFDILDNFWSTYEIMGVSVVDMRLWKWLYDNPDADKQQLQDAVLEIAIDVWNSYYAQVFGIKDSPILAIYSHMIDYPLYLSAYPIGHLIEFQIEQQIEGKNPAIEFQRMLTQGRLTPNHWLMGAVGNKLSVEPTLAATQKSIDALTK